MASPTQVPPIRHRRSLSGPIILIAIGGVFLLGTMGLLNWGHLAHWFAHYWPVILIVAGIIKLIEYQAAQREGTRASGIGAGGIFLIILVVFFGLLATQASRFNWGELRDQIDIDDSDFTLFGQKYTYEDKLAQDFPAGSALHVTDIRGAVNVSAGDDSQIHVSVHKRINADSASEADKWNAGTKPTISVSGGVFSLNANNQAAGDHGIAVDLDITIPRKAPVTISTRYGDVSVVGRDGDVQISAQHDDVTTTDINGKVALTLEHSSARVSQIASDVSLEGRANDVSVGDVKGSVRLEGEFMESVKLSRLAQGVTFHSSRTDLQFFRLNGDLDLDSGDLSASDVVGPVRLSTRAKDVRLTGIAGDVRLQDEDGSVELHMSKLGSVQLENRKGDVQIYVPDKAGFQVDARSRGGDVETDFNELKVDNREEQATATGTVGGGGPHMVVTNEHGTIEIRKGSSVAEAPVVPPTPPSPKAPRARSAKPSTPSVTEN